MKFQKYEKIMQSAKRGVIYMSFGTVTKSRDMPPETKSAFLEAFAEFPDITFLWKYEAEDGIADGYKNVITGNWWPQKDILGKYLQMSRYYVHCRDRQGQKLAASGFAIESVVT
jgi:UDP:flavonoid glycosyltransferase YjiC (YdhE family)